MADYIQKNILFQAYVHIDADFDQLDQGGGAEARRYLESYIDDRAKHFLDPSVSTELDFKEGSIKAYATVYGSLKSCLPPVLDGNFVAAINQLYWFTRKLSGAAVMELSFKTNTYLSAIERTEARPGVIGQTKRVLDDIVGLAVMTANATDRERNREKVTRRIKGAHSRARRLIEVLSDQEDKILVKAELRKIVARLPATLAGNDGGGVLLLQYEKTYLELVSLLDAEF